MEEKQTRAMILKKTAYGEADWIVTLFSKDEGRFSGMAKSARRSMKRFGGALEPGTLVTLRYAESRFGGLASLREAFVERPVTALITSLKKIAALNRTLELALLFLPERQRADEKFELMERRLAVIAGADPTASEALEYELNWLSLIGFGPHLSGCASCGGMPHGRDDWSFDFDHAGIFCPGCGKKSAGKGMPLPAHVARLFCRREEADQHSTAHARLAIGEYFSHLAGKPLKSSSVELFT